MNAERLGRLVRTLRVRQQLTQAALASRVGIGRRAVSMLERGLLREMTVGDAERIVAGLGARLSVRLWWNGPELDRMLDADHAAIAAAVKSRLERWGWVIRVEVSYSRYGERGRIDLLAWHPRLRWLLVIEVKTQLVDVQDLLGTLDVKVRLARHVAEQFGWEVGAVIPAIVFAEDPTNRRRLHRVDTLFDRFSLRGRAALSWLRTPADAPSCLLWFVPIRPGARSLPGSKVRVRTVSSIERRRAH